MAGASELIGPRNVLPQAGLPAKIIIGATTDAFSDPLEICKQDIREAISLAPQCFNVLQIVDLSEKVERSYTGLDKTKVIQAGVKGFIFDAGLIGINRPIFDDVNEYVMMGGDMGGNLRRAFISVLALKGLHANRAVFELFREDGFPYHAALGQVDKVLDMGIKRHPEVVFHFPMTAVYPRVSNLGYTNDNIPGAKMQRFDSWDEYGRSVHNYEQEIHKYVVDNMPFEYWDFLRASGLNIFGFIDGVPMKGQISAGPSRDPLVRMHFWSSVDKLAGFIVP